ncbi:MAG: CotH kinase family protein [Planctomycetes bacterium]|nr:CotH kinase family protein [Planctomycetota bacterium]
MLHAPSSTLAARAALALVGLTALAASPAQSPRRADADAHDPARELFAGRLVRIAVAVSEESKGRLRESPREYAPARVSIDGKDWPSAGIKLKGAAGSFREFDDRPGLTVDLDRFGEAAPFHGLAKFHLNNAVQDGTWLHEWLGAQVFLAAGYPAPRVAHAVLELDGRKLGLYVLREPFDRRLLDRAFGDGSGNLYDGGFCQDLDAELEKDSGAGVDDRSDLRALVEVCSVADDDVTGTRLAERVDVPALIDFVALESMLGHWDGYALNRNNYRVYLDPRDGRARFLPHGMDQLFGDAEASVLSHPPALVASAVLARPEWRKQYRARVRALVPVFAPERWRPRIRAMAERLEPALVEMGDDVRDAFRDAVRDLEERVAARHASLLAQSKAPEPRPLEFRGARPILVKGWKPAAETEEIALRRKGVDGVMAYELSCEARDDDAGSQVAAWRTTVLLARGRYRLLASIRTAGLRSGSRDDEGHENGGAFLAVDDARSERLLGDHRWTASRCEFEVGEFQREVELALRVRADDGIAWFRIDSLQLERMPD